MVGAAGYESEVDEREEAEREEHCGKSGKETRDRCDDQPQFVVRKGKVS